MICASIGAVTWQDAKAIADTWADQYLPQDLRGRQFSVPSFPDAATAEFFSPQRTLADHQMITSALCKLARKRGARIVHVSASREAYGLVTRTLAEDDADVRQAFIQQLYRVEDISG